GRMLFARVGCSSMFELCTKRFKMSHGEADRRILAARMAKRHPWILEKIESGDLHPSGLRELAKLAAVPDFDDLLRQACGLSKEDILHLVARRHSAPAERTCTVVP